MTQLHYIGRDLQSLAQLDITIPDGCMLASSDKLPDKEAIGELVLFDTGNFESFGEQSCRDYIRTTSDAGIPVIMVWSSDNDHQMLAMDCGCADFICPPFHRPVVRSKIRTHLKLAATLTHQATEGTPADIFNGTIVDFRNELAAVQDAAILCLAAIARVRDHSTGNHILRTQHYVRSLAEHLRHHPRFEAELDDDEMVELLYKTASLHDIGKVAIPDAILQKPGRLTPGEYEIMKQHSEIGYRALRTAEQLLENSVCRNAARFLKIGQQVTRSHHERWDGEGYPQGLKGPQIPVVARLMAVADVYDAVVSRRPYKEARPHQLAVEVLQNGRGSHFDPAVVDAFMELEKTFEQISGILEQRFPSLAKLTLHSIDGLLPD